MIRKGGIGAVPFCMSRRAGPPNMPLAANAFKGCSHGCRYCFGPAALRGKDRDNYCRPVPKDRVAERLARDLGVERLRGDDREILLSFIGDPYVPVEYEEGAHTGNDAPAHRSREAICPSDQGRDPRVQGLFDLLQHSEKARFGSTVVFMDDSARKYWETHARANR